MVTSFSYATWVSESGSLSLNGCLHMLVQLLLLSLKGKKKWSELERIAAFLTARVHAVPPLLFSYGSSYGVMPSRSALRGLQGWRQDCKASDTRLKGIIVQERTSSSCWILRSRLNPNHICEILGFAQDFCEFRAVHTVEMLKQKWFHVIITDQGTFTFIDNHSHISNQ